MRSKIIPIISGLVLMISFLTSCEDSTYKEYKGNIPVYMSYQDLRTAVKPGQTADIKNPGKIYFKDNYIFMVEELKGIHVFDNSDPSAPVKKDFISVPGISDVSIAGSTMYVDSYVDMVVLDVQDIMNIHEVGRVNDILPYTVPPTGNSYPMANVDESRGVVADWKVGTVREKVETPYNPYPYPMFYDKGGEYLLVNNSMGASSGVSGSGVGLGGSMARFGIKGNTLYLVDNTNLRIFDISAKISPVKVTDMYAGWGIETMFLTDKTMFLGTSSGMLIYDISDPQSPNYKSMYSHIRSCDPVIVDDTLAYVTLRSGTNCGSTVNSLDVIDIKNLVSPALLKSYSFINPQGLGKDGNILFICDGNAGLKIYDASDPFNITANLLYTYPAINTFDVIPVNGKLIMIGDDGLYQYDYSDIGHITLLSKIPVVK